MASCCPLHKGSAQAEYFEIAERINNVLLTLKGDAEEVSSWGVLQDDRGASFRGKALRATTASSTGTSWRNGHASCVYIVGGRLRTYTDERRVDQS